MKKLLSMLAVSTLVGTSASNLKPLFTNNVNQSFKSNQSNKNVNIHGENDNNPFVSKIISKNEVINSSTIAPNGDIYVLSSTGSQGDTTSKLYKSKDGFDFTEIKVFDIFIETLVIAPNGDIYGGTLTQGLWKSTNGGSTFNQVVSDKFDRFGMENLLITSDGTIYVGSFGLYKSTDNGDTFNQINEFNRTSILKLSIVSNGDIYVGTNGKGLWKSRNNGEKFDELKEMPNNINIYDVLSAPSGDIYVKTYGNGLWKSNDGGKKFSKIIEDKITFGSLAIGPNGDIYVLTYHDGLWKSANGGEIFETVKEIEKPRNIVVGQDGTIYVGTEKGLWKNSNNSTFKKITGEISEQMINSLNISAEGIVYTGTYGKGLFAINLINKLININTDGFFADEKNYNYGGIIYNSEQKLDIKDNILQSVKLDNKNITIPSKNLNLTNGEHTLILTLKDKTLASVFGGDVTTGTVTYKLWVKTSIDEKDINYSTNTDDTDLTDLSLGFVSTSGNTINCPIIQTKSKDGSIHNAPLITKLDDVLIDYPNSYYIQGTVDESTNDFKATGSKQILSPTTTITKDSTYHLHLVDTVNNSYDSYLELGQDNWKLKGTFNDTELNQLKTKLNVEVDLTDPQQLARANGWLSDYKKIVSVLFEKSLKANGKGFDSEIKNELENDFKWFLKPLTYDIANEPKFDKGIDKDKLDKTIRDTAEKCLQDGLTDLPQNLNIDFKNVTDKQTLDNCKTWSNNYEKYNKENVSKWITDISNVASRGFATSQQILDIKKYINDLPFNKYLKPVEWTPNLTASGYDDKYLQYVELDKLQSDTINWVNNNMKDINTAYQQAIKNAESGLNLHGYNIDTLLNGKKMPQTKSEIDNFADGQSFHDWLQSQANIKFHGWQLTMGLGIGIPLFLIALGIAWFVRKATDPRYNPFARARKLDKNENRTLKSNINKKSKKSETKNE